MKKPYRSKLEIFADVISICGTIKNAGLGVIAHYGGLPHSRASNIVKELIESELLLEVVKGRKPKYIPTEKGKEFTSTILYAIALVAPRDEARDIYAILASAFDEPKTHYQIFRDARLPAAVFEKRFEDTLNCSFLNAKFDSDYVEERFQKRFFTKYYLTTVGREFLKLYGQVKNGLRDKKDITFVLKDKGDTLFNLYTITRQDK